MEQRLIDAIGVISVLQNIKNSLDGAPANPADMRAVILAVMDIIKERPTVDAVPVVRCGECRHYRDGRCYRGGYEYDKWASGDASESPKNAPVYYGLKATDFCSYGEPRTPPAE